MSGRIHARSVLILVVRARGVAGRGGAGRQGVAAGGHGKKSSVLSGHVTVASARLAATYVAGVE